MSRNYKKNQIYFLAFFLIFSILITGLAFAQMGDNEDVTNFKWAPGGVTAVNSPEISNPLGVKTFIEAISKILDYLIYISIPILALMILWGGFQILTAREAPEKIKNGKTTIMWAIVGFIIVLASKGMALIFIEIFR